MIHQDQNFNKARPWYFALGIALIILGTFAFYFSTFTTMLSVLFLSAILLTSGLFQFAHAFFERDWRGFSLDLLMGIFTFIPGLLLALRPDVGAITLTLLFATVFMIKGLSRIAIAISTRFAYWQWAVLSGLLTFILGICIFYEWPLGSFWIIGLFVSIDLIFNGWALLVLSILEKRKTNLGRSN